MDLLDDKVTDADDNVYNTIKIGNQIWMAENMKTTRYKGGTQIPLCEVGDIMLTAGYCWYNNNIMNKEKYGALYNHRAACQIAPKGWHLPTYSEWKELEDYLVSNGYNFDGTTMGNKIAKSMAAQTDWASSMKEGAIGNDLSKNNASGFSAIPVKSIVGPEYRGGSARWWSSTRYYQESVYAFGLNYDDESLEKYVPNDSCWNSVRLVRDK